MNLNTGKRIALLAALIAVVTICAPWKSLAGIPQDSQTRADRANDMSRYQIVMVDRTVKAVKYEHRSGSTKINFRGTELMPSARGEAKVDSHRGAMEVKVEFADMQRPTTFGPEYLTYVMWAISPEGRAVNLGEVLIGGNHRSKLDVTTDLQAFAMIVTAEPYYAVRRPSNVVVLENEIRPDTAGSTEIVDAKYELIGRGGYIPTGYRFDPVVLNTRLPLEFFEARNALRIAESAGAAHYATTSYDNAVGQMKQADEMAGRRELDKKSLSATSRLVVETSEDAREIAVKRIDEERAEARRTGDANRIASAQSDASNARLDTADANRARIDAERAARNAQDATRAAAAGQAQAEQDTAIAQADSDRDRSAAINSDQQLQKALREREELRARLLVQLNAILETRDTARGLVVNMSDVLFDTAKFSLRPIAREKLAKISGIVLAYPSLVLAIEGNTDSVGGDAYNQQLSEDRAGSVRDYLAHEGIPNGSMTVHGFGKMQPIASNDTEAGRQQNRRVELVVSGDVIGDAVGGTPAAMVIRPVAPQPQQ